MLRSAKSNCERIANPALSCSLTICSRERYGDNHDGKWSLKEPTSDLHIVRRLGQSHPVTTTVWEHSLDQRWYPMLVVLRSNWFWDGPRMSKAWCALERVEQKWTEYHIIPFVLLFIPAGDHSVFRQDQTPWRDFEPKQKKHEKARKI